MIKNDSKYANSDNWLAEEIRREQKHSAWDFDDASKLRQEHEDNCDAREKRNYHEYRHAHRDDLQQETMEPAAAFWMVIDIFAVVALVFFSIVFRLHNFLPAVLLFLAINPGIFISLWLFKRTPSAGYYLFVLIMALAMELVILLNRYPFFFRRYF